MQAFIHYFFHLAFPAILALLIFRDDWLRVYLLLMLTMLVDLDHLLASPVFEADRCSLGFHPLHSYPAVGLYALMLLLPRPFHIIATGLLLHMATDLLDCAMTMDRCRDCLVQLI